MCHGCVSRVRPPFRDRVSVVVIAVVIIPAAEHALKEIRHKAHPEWVGGGRDDDDGDYDD